MAAHDPTDRSVIAQIAAHDSWAKTIDRPARTAPARAALEAKFLQQADGDPVRAEHLRKAYFTRLALTSAQARRRASRGRLVAEAAAAELRDFGGGAA